MGEISITELEYLKLYMEEKQAELNKLRMCDLSVIYRLISKEIYKKKGCGLCSGGFEHIQITKENDVLIDYGDGTYMVKKCRYCPNCGKDLR